MDYKYVVGVDLGGTKIYTALVDLEGKIIKEIVLATEAEKGPEHIMNNIIISINTVIDGINIEEIRAIGIGSPGPLDVKNGLIVETPNLPFKNFNIVGEIEKVFKIKTYLDNDANAATQAEFLFGAGKGTENMVYITVSTGVGAGVILNGKIYRGSTSNAAELGHTTVNPGGPRCGCGNRGCVERMSSGTAIMKRAVEAVSTNVRTNLKMYNHLTAKEVFDEYYKGDLVAKEIIDEALEYLGIFVANVANSFDPDMIVLGGGVIKGGNVVLERVRSIVDSRALPMISANVKILEAELGGKAGVLGAAAIAIMEK